MTPVSRGKVYPRRQKMATPTNLMKNHVRRGYLEAMIQVRLSASVEKVAFEKLTAGCSRNGFLRIKNLDTATFQRTPITYGPGDIEGG